MEFTYRKIRIAILAIVGLLIGSAVLASEGVHWSYHGESGPSQWGELSEEFALCGSGQEQSPIDIDTTSVVSGGSSDIELDYMSSAINILNNGHTLQVNYDPHSFIKLNGVQFDLLQYHFHTPSEHEIDGQLADAEMHLVHQNADGQLAVIAVLINEGESDNPAFDTTVDHLPAEEGPVETVAAVADANKLLPADASFYRYMGSLTTPPCSQDVIWSVMTEPVTLSKAQISALEAILGENNRPVQPLNGRSITLQTQ